jgi:surfeit locus 1 family protein
MSRAEDKRLLFAAFDQHRGTNALFGPVDDAAAPELRFQHMELAGNYDSEHQVLIDNMVYAGQAGYQVLTPLRTGRTAVLVNRGWVAANPDRRRLPDLPISAKQRRVSGRLDLLPRPGLKLAAPAGGRDDPWPRRLLFPSAGEIEQELGYAVQNYQLLLDPDSADGFVRDWRPAVVGAERHVGYALQWFSFAVALSIIYVAVNLKRPGNLGVDD